ncbi:MAG TPA: F0F1 ATP synthase subunit gamma, partial [Candidatus Saccharimonadales bacterium]|nr:F0F1 ATP synthase subunit gamma [Candidatus Saccharimonadales bacterium]
YRQIRVDELFHFGRTQFSGEVIQKELMILITAEGNFSGDIDRRLIGLALQQYDPAKNALIVIGHHGAAQLAERGIKYQRSFKTPEQDLNINTAPLLEEVRKYASTVVYYPQYKSLMTQAVKQIRLSAAVLERGSQIKDSQDVIDEASYIFEPSTHAVVDHLENSMIQITLGEVILESKLAQYASRFKAMTTARRRAQENQAEVGALYNRSRRQEKDERLRETTNSLREFRL